jgi:hypothetical protein
VTWRDILDQCFLNILSLLDLPPTLLAAINLTLIESINTCVSIDISIHIVRDLVNLCRVAHLSMMLCLFPLSTCCHGSSIADCRMLAAEFTNRSCFVPSSCLLRAGLQVGIKFLGVLKDLLELFVC